MLPAQRRPTAHGGQVLLSAATRALVDGGVTDLGEHRLKDFAEPVAISQLGEERFPPLKTISCDGPDDVALVNQCIVEELLQDICLLDFGHHTAAVANLGLWRRVAEIHRTQMPMRSASSSRW